MMNTEKYHITDTDFISAEWVKKSFVAAPPVWCSIDLMDGNRATAEAMTHYEKEEYFKLLCEIGFKEINIGNPLIQSDFDFLSSLVMKNLISDDISILVCTDADAQNIDKILASVSDVKNVILNIKTPILLNGESDFDALKKELIDSIVYAAEKIRTCGRSITLEITIECFRNSEVKCVVELFNSIANIIIPDESNKIIFNISTASEYTMPHISASIIEYISKNLMYRQGITLSFRPSNDCGTGVSTAEMALLAGAERIEGSLFGVGEKTGNVDIVNLAMNIFSKGVHPGLNLTNLPVICEKFERFTGIHIYEKMPFSGESAFSVFSSNHQNVISAAMRNSANTEQAQWNIPYLIIDPRDVGRDFSSDVIRSDGFSGRNSIIYILNKKYGLQIPVRLKSELAKKISKTGDNETMLKPETIYKRFLKHYVDNTPVFSCPESYSEREANHKTETVIRLSSGNSFTVKSDGNGRLDAVSNAFKKYFDIDFDIDIYEEHALTTGSKSKAVSYVCIKCGEGSHWGVGIDEDIFRSSVNALTVAVNQMKKVRNFCVDADPRLIEMLDFIKDNYDTVTLSSIANRFYLSKQYVSKYIKENSGHTFCENVQNIRMKKAEEMLLTTNITVESVAEKSGYPSVEHFNRRFKKIHGITPLQFRKKK